MLNMRNASKIARQEAETAVAEKLTKLLLRPWKESKEETFALLFGKHVTDLANFRNILITNKIRQEIDKNGPSQ